MITEDYVSYETAQLLKSKGFDELCYACYEYFRSGVTMYSGWPFEYKGEPVHNTNDRVKCPTLQMAIKWLREKYNVHIEIRITNHSLSELIDIPKYYWVLFDASKVTWMGESTANKPIAFDTPEEAYANAIKYCLEKII